MKTVRIIVYSTLIGSVLALLGITVHDNITAPGDYDHAVQWCIMAGLAAGVMFAELARGAFMMLASASQAPATTPH